MSGTDEKKDGSKRRDEDERARAPAGSDERAAPENNESRAERKSDKTRGSKRPSTRIPIEGSDEPEDRTIPAGRKRARPKRRAPEHEKELEAAPERDARSERPEPVSDETATRRASPLPAPRPAPSTGLETIASTDEAPVREAESPTSGPTRPQALEERVSRSILPEDIDRMRSLAEKVYYEGWTHLSVDEQLAFVYNTRFLKYLSERDRQRPEVRSTIYRFIGAQGKSLGLESRYRIAQLSTISERFFERVLTPVNAPELYRRVENTDYFIGKGAK